MPSDSQLMERLKGGDVQALGPLYERYKGVVNAVVQMQASGLSASEAEDVCHEVFLTLMDVAGRYRPGNTLKGWLCGIAVRKARRLRQGRWLRQGLLGRVFGQREQTTRSTSNERMDLERAMASLSAPLREVVVLHLIEQLSSDEIAAALGISEKTVWTRLHRARARMRDALEETP